MKKLNLFRLSFVVSIISVVVLGVRFFGICTPLESLSNDFEIANRLNLGQKYGSDIVTAIAPLSFYSVAIFLKALGNFEWVVHFHVYFWWLLSLWLGWRLTLSFQPCEKLLSISMVLAAGISCPIYSYQASYSYMANTLVAMAALSAINFRSNKRLRWVILSGSLSALAVYTKQNVGILTLPIFLMVFGLPFRLRLMGSWFLGFAVSCLLPLLWWSKDANLSEITQMIFVDGGDSKGGALKILVRGLPRIIFGIKHGIVSNIRLYESIATLLVIIVLGASIAKRRPTQKLTKFELKHIGFVLLSLVASLATTYIVLPEYNRTLEFLSLFVGVSPGNLLVQIVTIFIFVVLIWSLIKNVRNYNQDRFFLTAFCLLVLFSSNVSGPHYLLYSAPIVIPIFLVGSIAFLNLNTALLTLLVSVVVFLMPLLNDIAPRFVRLSLIEDYDFFRGMKVTSENEDSLKIRWLEIRPLVVEKKTLWLVTGGPSSAFGGIPVPSIPTLDRDQYSARVEPRIFEVWSNNPPERIVFERILPAKNSTGFLFNSLESWVPANYYPIYQKRGLQVWALKEALK